MYSQTIYVNNTGADLREFHNEIVAAIKNGGALPEEIADVFTLSLVTVEDGIRGVVGWA